MIAAAPNGNHYSHAERVHIISIAPSWHPNISSEQFAAGRPRRTGAHNQNAPGLPGRLKKN